MAKPKRRRSVARPILLRLPVALLERIRKLATKDRRSINGWCELALEAAAKAA